MVLALFLQACNAEPAAKEPFSDPTAFDSFVRDTLKASNYRLGQADLNSDGDAEILVYSNGSEACGTGGCNLFVVERNDGGFRMSSDTTIVHLPVRILPTSHNGWRDLAVTVYGGGILEPYEARLPFDGQKYAENPTVPPASPVDGEKGEDIIVANPGDWPDL